MATPSDQTKLQAGFAKLKGEDFEFYMQRYSIILGRNSKKATVDFDLSQLGGGMNISRQHARIYYDFDAKGFFLEVLGKNGAYVEGTLHLPNPQHVPLNSKDVLQIGDKKIFFLLPSQRPGIRNVSPFGMNVSTGSEGVKKRRKTEASNGVMKAAKMSQQEFQAERDSGSGERAEEAGDEEEYYSGSNVHSDTPAAPASWQDSGGERGVEGTSRGKDKAAAQRRSNSEAHQTEEELVSAVAAILSDTDSLPMATVFAELTESYRELYATAKELHVLPQEPAENGGYLDGDNKPAKPWAGLAAFLRRHPAYLSVTSKQKGRMVVDYVSLVA
eukprot:jgi/Mesen1/3115/ME000184S02176